MQVGSVLSSVPMLVEQLGLYQPLQAAVLIADRSFMVSTGASTSCVPCFERPAECTGATGGSGGGGAISNGGGGRREHPEWSALLLDEQGGHSHFTDGESHPPVPWSAALERATRAYLL